MTRRMLVIHHRSSRLDVPISQLADEIRPLHTTPTHVLPLNQVSTWAFLPTTGGLTHFHHHIQQGVAGKVCHQMLAHIEGSRRQELASERGGPSQNTLAEQ